MVKKLEVYGGTLFHLVGNNRLQLRTVVAAHSKAEAMRLLEITPHQYKHSFCITSNAVEVQAAMGNPGVVFRQLWKEERFYIPVTIAGRWG